MKTALFAIVTITLLCISTGDVRAQGNIAPSSQLGIGVNTSGMTVQYAINPGFHIGFLAGLRMDSDSSGSSTSYNFGPYARFLFEGTLNPFIEAGISFADVGSSQIGVYGAFGLEYFASRNVGVFAETGIVNFQFDPETLVSLGIFSSRAGVEWFFDR